MIQFHLDQHVSAAIARGLRLRGIDATTTSGAGLQDADDDEHVSFAFAEQRVVFTQDHDFLRIHSKSREHAGIVYNKQGTRTIGEIVRFLEFLSDCLEPSDMVGQVEYF